MYEIRSYHYDPAKFDAYKKWALELAVPFLRANLDVVGFWVDNGDPPEITGAKPMQLEHGSANVTWIIRWIDKATRDAAQASVFGSDEWVAIWKANPDVSGYLQMESRFVEAV